MFAPNVTSAVLRAWIYCDTDQRSQKRKLLNPKVLLLHETQQMFDILQ